MLKDAKRRMLPDIHYVPSCITVHTDTSSTTRGGLILTLIDGSSFSVQLS